MTHETDEYKFAILRQQAEEIIQGRPPNLADLSPEDVQRLIYDLQVHQIELQLQNEELQRTQVELWEARNRYADLYNFAPVGYFTLDVNGAIVEANLTGAVLLNVDRSFLIGAPLSRFVAPEDRDRYAVYRVRLWQSEERQTAEIKLIGKDGAQFRAWLEGVAAYNREGRFVQARLTVSDMTERARAEEALEESQRRLQALFNNTLDAILLADDEAHFVDVNPAACALLGYNREELLQLSTWEITPGGYRELGQELWQAFIRSGQQGGEYTVLRKDGTTVEADYRAVANIVPGLHLSVLRDITERKKAQQALEAQRVFLRQVIDINPNFIFAKDREGRFTLVNQAVAEAYGSTVEELVGKTDADFNPNPTEVEHFQRDDLEVINSLQEKFIPEEVITDATGKVRWLQTVKRPLVGPNGLADQLLGVATDITERKRIEEELRLSRDQLTIILQGVADGITVQDEAGRLIYANDAAARLTGYPSAQAMLEAPLQELMQKFKVLDESGRPFPLAQLPGRLAMQGELTPSATVRFQVVATGEEYWSYIKARPVFDKQGQVKLAVNIFQDITELKRSEQAQRFLAEASNLLASSLNYEITLASIANLTVPRMADWCAVDVLQEDETVQRLAVAHVDPAKVELAHELQHRYPPDWDAPTGVPNVLRTGQSEFYPEITDAMLEADARDAEHLQSIQELTLRSAMVVPLKARGRTLGAMTFVWAESGHRYDENDLALAEELAHRAAIAVDNAQLYQEAQRLNTELEQRVIKRTAELQAANKKLESEIAERKRAEAQLRQEKEFSESLINSSFDGILAFDRDYRYTVWNPAMERLTGISKAETLGKSAFDVFPFLREIGEDKYFFEALAGQIAAVEDRPYRVPQTGQQGFFEGHYSPIPGVSGQVVGALGVIRDITQRKNMEAELDEIQHRLVESRERERLQLGRELHDGPIQDLYGVAFGLEAFKETLDQVSLAQFRVVQTTMWQVISALRFISSELRPQTLTPFGLEKAILSHVEHFQETHPELQVKLDLMPDGQILPEGMRLSLFRIYQELLNNAAQHARASQVWIRFILDSEQVMLEVQDDGRGFEAPQRWIEWARQGQLGLVETLERAEAISGQMKVVSAPGEGALIRVTVPRPDTKGSLP